MTRFMMKFPACVNDLVWWSSIHREFVVRCRCNWWACWKQPFPYQLHCSAFSHQASLGVTTNCIEGNSKCSSNRISNDFLYMQNLFTVFHSLLNPLDLMQALIAMVTKTLLTDFIAIIFFSFFLFFWQHWSLTRNLQTDIPNWTVYIFRMYTSTCVPVLMSGFVQTYSVSPLHFLPK